MATFDLDPCPCPYCGEELEAATGVRHNNAPVPNGSFTVCLYCQGLSMFGDNLRFRVPTDIELDEIAADPELGMQLIVAIAFTVEYQRMRARRKATFN